MIRRRIEMVIFLDVVPQVPISLNPAKFRSQSRGHRPFSKFDRSGRAVWTSSPCLALSSNLEFMDVSSVCRRLPELSRELADEVGRRRYIGFLDFAAMGRIDVRSQLERRRI